MIIETFLGEVNKIQFFNTKIKQFPHWAKPAREF